MKFKTVKQFIFLGFIISLLTIFSSQTFAQREVQAFLCQENKVIQDSQNFPRDSYKNHKGERYLVFKTHLNSPGNYNLLITSRNGFKVSVSYKKNEMVANWKSIAEGVTSVNRINRRGKKHFKYSLNAKVAAQDNESIYRVYVQPFTSNAKVFSRWKTTNCNSHANNILGNWRTSKGSIREFKRVGNTYQARFTKVTELGRRRYGFSVGELSIKNLKRVGNTNRYTGEIKYRFSNNSRIEWRKIMLTVKGNTITSNHETMERVTD